MKIKIGPLEISFGREPKGGVVERLNDSQEAAPALLKNHQPLNPMIGGKEKKIVDLAIRHGWRLVDHRPVETRLRFKKGIDDVIDVWTGKMTVASIINHPKRGRQPLYRKKVSMEMLENCSSIRGYTPERVITSTDMRSNLTTCLRFEDKTERDLCMREDHQRKVADRLSTSEELVFQLVKAKQLGQVPVTNETEFQGRRYQITIEPL